MLLVLVYTCGLDYGVSHQYFIIVSPCFRPFPTIAWCLFLLAFLAATLYVLAAYNVYSWINSDCDIVAANASPGEITLRMIGTLTEPDSFPHFVAWSSGKNEFVEKTQYNY